MRVFLAVPAAKNWVDSALGLVARLEGSLPKASWTRPDSWHLTLTFLGEIEAKTAEDFAAAMDPSFSAARSGELAETMAVTFPPHGAPRVLGVGFHPSLALDSLKRLADAAGAAARILGVKVQNRPFRPHITLARLRERWPREAVARFRDEIAAWRFPPWELRSCVLYRSRLDPAGPIHTPLREWTFGADRSEVPA